jgi:flagellar biosynthesis/type III secretory pathway protein FliH
MGHSETTTHEIRVLFAGRLTNAYRVAPEAPLPPFRRPSLPIAPIAQPVSAASASLWDSAVGRELAADREKINAALAGLRIATDELREKHDYQLAGLRNAAVELSLTIATQLLHRAVEADEFPVENMVRDMASQLVGETSFSVHLNPDDLKLLERRLGGEPLLPESGATKLVADPTLKRCECRVEGGDGSLLISDAARQLQEIREELLRNLAHASNART